MKSRARRLHRTRKRRNLFARSINEKHTRLRAEAGREASGGGAAGAPVVDFLPVFRSCRTTRALVGSKSEEGRTGEDEAVQKGAEARGGVRARNEWTCKYARGRFLGKGGASLLFAPLLSILTGIDSSCRTGKPETVALLSFLFLPLRHRRPNRLVSGGLSDAEVAPVFRRASPSFPFGHARARAPAFSVENVVRARPIG